MAPVAAKDAKSKKSSSAPKKPRAHPPYSEMIKEAIISLKERTGSSQIAIAKFIEEKQKPHLPLNFKKLLLVQLKKLVAADKLVKVKNSFKLPPKSSATEKKPKAPEKKPKAADVKPKRVAAAAAKPNPKPKAKAKAEAKPKPKAKPAKKVAKTVAALKSPAKKVAVAKVKKLKSIKSPVKKAAVKKGKK